MDIIFSELDGKHGCQIKLMCVLIGTSGDGSFAISEKWILARTGMTQQSYSRARRDLVERGWIDVKDGNIYLNINRIKEQKHNSHSKLFFDTTSCFEEHSEDVSSTLYEDVHNKKEIKKDKKQKRQHQGHTIFDTNCFDPNNTDFFSNINYFPSDINV